MAQWNQCANPIIFFNPGYFHFIHSIPASERSGNVAVAKTGRGKLTLWQVTVGSFYPFYSTGGKLILILGGSVGLSSQKMLNHQAKVLGRSVLEYLEEGLIAFCMGRSRNHSVHIQLICQKGDFGSFKLSI